MRMRGRGGKRDGTGLSFWGRHGGIRGGCGGMEGSCWSWMSFVMLELGVFGGDVWSRVLPRKDGCHVSGQRMYVELNNKLDY